MNAKQLQRKLVAAKLDGWKLIIQEEERVDLYLADEDAPETTARSRREQADITVYKRYGKLLGDASFTIFDENEAFAPLLKDALTICATAKKPSYPLPGKQRYAAVKRADTRILAAFKGGAQERALLQAWKKLHAAYRKERNVKLSAAELHLSRTAARVMNSAGLAGKTEATQLSVEIVLTSYRGRGKTRKEQEFTAALTVGRLADFDAASFVSDAARKARDILAAEKLPGIHTGGIVLTDDALRDFWAPELGFSPVLFHGAARMKHMGLSMYERGKQVTTNAGFTLLSDPTLPYNTASNTFDADGSASRKVTIIAKGTCVNFAASQRYGHYLSLPVTGGIGAVSIASGNERASALLTDGTIEVVAFSSFVPNSMSGDFSAEIRLGYIRKDGKRIPVRAAMFTGNVFRMLDAMRLARETMEKERYKGPAAVRFDAGCHLAGF